MSRRLGLFSFFEARPVGSEISCGPSCNLFSLYLAGPSSAPLHVTAPPCLFFLPICHTGVSSRCFDRIAVFRSDRLAGLTDESIRTADADRCSSTRYSRPSILYDLRPAHDQRIRDDRGTPKETFSSVVPFHLTTTYVTLLLSPCASSIVCL